MRLETYADVAGSASLSSATAQTSNSVRHRLQEHDHEKACPALDAGCVYRFSEKACPRLDRAGTPKVYELVRKFGIRTAWGSDVLFSPELAPRQSIMLTHLSRWYTNAETLRMATSVNADPQERALMPGWEQTRAKP